MNDIFSGVSTLETSLDYHLDRQVMLTANVANVDTPGYRPVDLGLLPPPAPPARGSGEVLLARTDPGHIDPQARPAMLMPYEDPSPSPGNDQNAVDLDRELAKVAANTLRYETASELVARRMGMLRYAIGDGLSG
jgi:flagellar basal-body rod protein FlgB